MESKTRRTPTWNCRPRERLNSDRRTLHGITGLGKEEECAQDDHKTGVMGLDMELA